MGLIKNKIKKKLTLLIDEHLNSKFEHINSKFEDSNKVNNNVNVQIESIRKEIAQIQLQIGAISENLRNINVIIPNKTDLISNDLEIISENLRNINTVIPKIEYLNGKADMLEVKLLGMLKNRTQSCAGFEEKSNYMQEQIQPDNKNNSYTKIDYFDFENHFRGSREKIKMVQQQYIKYFRNGTNILDLGCGRGEFLELLKENNITACGVDTYDEYVNYCNLKGYHAVNDDAIHFLESLNEKTDGIFAGQVAEHLNTDQLIDLCNLSYEKLESGSYAIFETPNPTSLAIYTNAFYLDPSHIKPVHPLTLKYFMEKAGFTEIEILYTENSKIDIEIPEIKIGDNEKQFNEAMVTVQKLLFGSQDYAVIAKKI